MSGARVNDRWLPLHYALREMRGGLSGFYVFVACITLGSMAIAGVGSLAASLADSLSREGQVILGGDLSFTLIQREASDAEKEFLRSRGVLSSAATLRAMARTSGDGQATLVELKAVDAAYPLYGAVTLDPPGPLVARPGAASELLVTSALGGVGVIFMFQQVLQPHLNSGALVPILQDWWPSFAGPFLYFPGHRHVPAPLRAFIDYVKGSTGV